MMMMLTRMMGVMRVWWSDGMGESDDVAVVVGVDETQMGIHLEQLECCELWWKSVQRRGER